MSEYLQRAKELRAIVTPHYNCAQAVLLPESGHVRYSEADQRLAADALMHVLLEGAPDT